MTYYDDKKTLSMVKVESYTHQILLREANEKGEPIAIHAGQLLDELILLSKSDTPHSTLKLLRILSS